MGQSDQCQWSMSALLEGLPSTLGSTAMDPLSYSHFTSDCSGGRLSDTVRSLMTLCDMTLAKITSGHGA